MAKGKELERIQQQAEATVVEAMDDAATADALNNLIFQMGGLDAINTIASNLNAAFIIRCQRIRDNKEYLVAGYERFDDFMDNFPQSPMSYKRFNYIEGIYKNLGADVFDLTSSAGLSQRQMKLLGKGNVEIDGEKIVVKTDDGPVEIEIGNRRQWLQSLQAFAKSNADKTAKIASQQKTIAEHDDKVRDLYNQIDEIRASKAADVEQDAHAMAVVTLGLAYRELIGTVEQMTPVERQQFARVDFERIAGWMQDLSITFERGADWTTLMPANTDFDQMPGTAPSSDDDIISRALDDADDNDSELAEKM